MICVFIDREGKLHQIRSSYFLFLKLLSSYKDLLTVISLVHNKSQLKTISHHRQDHQSTMVISQSSFINSGHHRGPSWLSRQSVRAGSVNNPFRLVLLQGRSEKPNLLRTWYGKFSFLQWYFF